MESAKKKESNLEEKIAQQSKAEPKVVSPKSSKKEFNSDSFIQNILSHLKQGQILPEETLKQIISMPDITEEIKNTVLYLNQQNLMDLKSKEISNLELEHGLTKKEAIDLLKFKEESSKLKNGKKILHFTDSEVEAEDLELRILRLLGGKSAPDKDEIVVHTGDLAPDFINLKKYNTQAYLPEVLIEEGELTGKDAEEFNELYSEFLEELGVKKEDLIRGQLHEKLHNKLVYALYDHQEPQFKTKAELKEYRKKKERLNALLMKGMKNHARRNYSKIKEKFSQYGFTKDNFILLPGNHDIPEVMREILGEYMIREGEIKTIKGQKFANPLQKATGSIYGPKLSKIMGATELKEQLPELKYETESFKKLKNYLHENGFSHYTDEHLDSLISASVQEQMLGIGNKNKVFDYNKQIEEELLDKVNQRLSSLKDKIPKEKDVIILGHGDITDRRHAGLEEIELRRLLKNKGMIYIGGHNHGFNTNTQDKNLFLQPGASASGNMGTYLLDEESNFIGGYFSSINEDGLPIGKFYTKSEIPTIKSSEYSGSQGGEN